MARRKDEVFSFAEAPPTPARRKLDRSRDFAEIYPPSPAAAYEQDNIVFGTDDLEAGA